MSGERAGGTREGRALSKELANAATAVERRLVDDRHTLLWCAEEPGPAATREHFLGTWVNRFTVPAFLEHLAKLVGAGRSLVLNHNLNSLALLDRSVAMRSLYEKADAIFVDGLPVVWLGRLLGADIRAEHRIGVLDWIWPFVELAENKGWTVVHVGGDEEIAIGASAAIHARHPGLELVVLDGYFDQRRGSEENAAVLERVAAARPDVLLVGMGMPRQEQWIEENLDDLPACPIVTVGGILGFVAQVRPTPPRWTGRLGVEWLYRLTTEPLRLWRRYLVEPLGLAPRVARELKARRRKVRPV